MSPKTGNKDSINVGGDVLGAGMPGDATTDAPFVIQARFGEIYYRIANDKLEDKAVDKSEILTILKQIENEIKKSDSADPIKVKRWLGILSEVSGEIFEATVAAIMGSKTRAVKAVPTNRARGKRRKGTK